MKGKTVVVTGASSGIGEALARECAVQGANVVLGARSLQKLQLIVGDIRSKGGEATYCAVDVTKPEECRNLIDTAVGEYGGVDVLICNAGLSMRALFDDVDLEVLHRLMDVNFWGTVYCTKYALPYLQASHGSLVGISSVAGLHGLPGRTGYSASKYAMTGFLETVRIENLKKGLHVMVACPGFTASNVRFSARTADGSSQGETPRDEAKMIGGLGCCGRELCCSTYLDDFPPVSINMAKDQNLSLNPAKISGVCGRLMCCLAYEESAYEYLNSIMPMVGSTVRTPDGLGTVLEVNPVSGYLRVRCGTESLAPRYYKVGVCEYVSGGKRPPRRPDPDDDYSGVRNPAPVVASSDDEKRPACPRRRASEKE